MPLTPLRRHVAWPSDHGSWGLLLSPLVIGLFAGGRWTTASLYMVVAALAGFLVRQPITIAIKVFSERRSRQDLLAALLWSGVYATIGLLCVLGLVVHGFPYVLYLAVPGLPVFAWHLVLVSRRAERRQVGMQLVGAGALALSAPAAMWVGVGRPESLGWLLWVLVWAQSAAAIMVAYLRLEQRTLASVPAIAERLRLGRRALLLTTGMLAGVAALAAADVVPRGVWLPYGLLWAEAVRCTLRPALGAKPRTIGRRQLAVSVVVTVLFVVTWR
jgi:hypothetical protein